MEALQKRASNPKTGRLPMISVVIFLAENIDQEIRDNLQQMEFVGASISTPASVSQTFDSILEVLYRRQIIQSEYNYLMKQKHSVKYPHINIFDDPEDILPQQEKDDSSDQEIDDWIPSSTLLPKFMHELRESALISGGCQTPSSTSRRKKRTVREEYLDRKRLDRLILNKMSNHQMVEDSILKSATPVEVKESDRVDDSIERMPQRCELSLGESTYFSLFLRAPVCVMMLLLCDDTDL